MPPDAGVFMFNKISVEMIYDMMYNQKETYT